mmetsp:Transcript_18779/g.38523  ORF Transcript_18779/g.38523 Transcript_18779/m.38523 type:complete len:99 (-) Transcript_18779:304-600(-)
MLKSLLNSNLTVLGLNNKLLLGSMLIRASRRSGRFLYKEICLNWDSYPFRSRLGSVVSFSAFKDAARLLDIYGCACSASSRLSCVVHYWDIRRKHRWG